MLKGVKKGLEFATKKATGFVEDKVKENIQERFDIYKRKIIRIVWQQALFLIGLMFFLIGIINIIAEELSLKYAYIISGLIAIIVSFLIKNNSK